MACAIGALSGSCFGRVDSNLDVNLDGLDTGIAELELPSQEFWHPDPEAQDRPSQRIFEVAAKLEAH